MERSTDASHRRVTHETNNKDREYELKKSITGSMVEQTDVTPMRESGNDEATWIE